MVSELSFDVEKIFMKNPTLGDVLFVEKFLKELDENLDRNGLVKALSRKVNSYKLNIILDYLVSKNKIGFDALGHVVYIYNPKMFKRFVGRRKAGL